MRIALFSDIHGNLIALDAVLADIGRLGGVDQCWVLGDLVAVGAQPVATLERLATLPHVLFTHGNTDRYITDGTRPRPHRNDVHADLRRLEAYGEVASTLSWTQGAIAASGWLPFLDDLPLEQRTILPDGTRLLGVHASPGMANGKGIRPDHPVDELNARVAGCAADLVVVGHTHWPMNTEIGGVHVINLGSVSNPVTPDGHAWYALLEANEHGYRVRQRRVAYDHAAVHDVLEQMRHPAAEYIAGFLRGEHERTWRGWPLPPVEDAGTN